MESSVVEGSVGWAIIASNELERVRSLQNSQQWTEILKDAHESIIRV